MRADWSRPPWRTHADGSIRSTLAGMNILRFEQRHVEWPGTWPPPEILWIVRQPSGAEMVVTSHEVAEIFEVENGATIEEWVQKTCSDLPDDVAAHPNILRGAEYVLVEP